MSQVVTQTGAGPGAQPTTLVVVSTVFSSVATPSVLPNCQVADPERTLPLSWIIAIIALILLAISLTYTYLQHRKAKQVMASPNIARRNTRVHSEYYEMSRPVRPPKANPNRLSQW